MISVSSDINYRLLNAREALPDVANPDEYEDFEPMTLEDAEDDADRILNNHDATDLDVTDLDEYEDFAPMTLEHTEDDAALQRVFSSVVNFPNTSNGLPSRAFRAPPQFTVPIHRAAL